MLKAFLNFAQAIQPTSHHTTRTSRLFYRGLSTNSAIARGVRKSRFPPDERRPTYLRNDSSKRTFDQHERPKERDTGRIRRPNHQQKQDIEDMEESARLRVGRQTPRQRNYLQGGRKPPFDTSSRENSTRSFQPSLTRGQFSTERPERPGRYPNTRPTAQPAYGSDRLSSTEGSPSFQRRGRSDPKAEFSQSRAGRYPNTGRTAQATYGRGRFESTERSPSSQRKDHYDPEADFSQSRVGPHRKTGSSTHTAYNSDRPKNTSCSSTFQRADHFDTEENNPRSRAGRYADIKPAVHTEYDPDALVNTDRSSPYRRKDSHSSEIDIGERRKMADNYFLDMDMKPAASEKTSNNSVYGNEAPIQRSDRSRFSEEEPKAPLSIPYTTPASEFLYGSSVVIAALKTARRKLYKLYLYNGEHRDTANQDQLVKQLARSRDIKVTKVQKEWLPLMDKMSAGRPHNGYVLEASPLPKLPVTGFHPVKGHQDSFHVILDHQTKEDINVNGKNPNIKYTAGFPRYPVVLMLDGILDPGNLGGILRSAYFLGIDAVAISNKHSAPLTPVALKASAGASESLPLISISHPAAFIEESQNNGWKFYAAVTHDSQIQGKQVHLSTSSLDNPATNHPCILLLGGEGEGLRWNLQKKADYLLNIEGDRSGQGGVDSLNVSVAAGLLCEAFLRKPPRSLKTKKDISPSYPVHDILPEKSTISKEPISEEALF